MARPRGTNADAVPPAVPYDSATPLVVVTPVARWPHDTTAWTQGLAMSDGRLLEGTGQVGRSEVREIERATGRVLRRTALPTPLFGEGVTVIGSRLYQLTWKHGRGYVYDLTSLALLDSFAYAGEGWGLATDGHRLYLSDGTSHVRVLDPRAGFRVERTLQVREAGRPVWMLNELEWVRGELWANVYQTDLIARIDPDGGVLGWVDVSGLLRQPERAAIRAREGVANGIAFDSVRQRVLLTGKLWPWMIEINLEQVAAARPAARNGDLRP